ncbi:hypothetical protein FA95DRAFT_1680431 [Auriscalpium vulgare]|uniref:Uncharacterized protein n=1 Tax=Auriscalpium vulgare TaxID=40419 RepID=A0ACB8RPB2_9AGAM|nr:hypothetical protein FA95DRAFT_1680431 [Auriscalpium vulgare]
MQTDSNIPPNPQRADSRPTPSERHTVAAAKAWTVLERAEAFYARIDVAHEELTMPPEELAAAYVDISAAFDDLATAIVELTAARPRSTLRTFLARSVPVVSCYLLCLIDKPEALSVVFAQAFLYAAVLVPRCTRRAHGNAYDESVHKVLTKGFLERICGNMGIGVFCMYYQHYGAAGATGLAGLATALVCLVIAAAVRYHLPPDAYDYLRTALRKHATHAGAQQSPPGRHQSPAAAHASYRADVTSQLAAARSTVRLASASRLTTRDACATFARDALHSCAPVAMCYLDLFWPARGAPAVSAITVVILSDFFMPGRLHWGMSVASALAFGFVFWSIGKRIYYVAHPLCEIAPTLARALSPTVFLAALVGAYIANIIHGFRNLRIAGFTYWSETCVVGK